jgi:hypothetical protein
MSFWDSGMLPAIFVSGWMMGRVKGTYDIRAAGWQAGLGIPGSAAAIALGGAIQVDAALFDLGERKCKGGGSQSREGEGGDKHFERSNRLMLLFG